MIEYRVRDHCWYAGSVVGEGKYKKRLTPRPCINIEYSHRVDGIRTEPGEGSPLDQC